MNEISPFFFFFFFFNQGTAVLSFECTSSLVQKITTFSKRKNHLFKFNLCSKREHWTFLWRGMPSKASSECYESQHLTLKRLIRWRLQRFICNQIAHAAMYKVAHRNMWQRNSFHNKASIFCEKWFKTGIPKQQKLILTPQSQFTWKHVPRCRSGVLLQWRRD